jgi:hypothetical protein
MKSEMAFCASSRGVRRAASRATKSFIVASSSQAFPTSSMDGPAPHLDSVTDRAQLSPCPVQLSPANVDLTVGHSFGKWQVAWVGFHSSDLNTPVLGYQKQSQFAMGGLLGYDFGPVVLQGYLTSDVYEKNYGGKGVRGWVRIVLPLQNVFGAPPPSRGSR